MGVLRIAVFGSFYRGYHVLDALLSGPIRERVEVVGVATDDPGQSYVSPTKRVWQYPHTPRERTMVADLARERGIDVFTGRVKTAEFYARIENDWRPDLCVMATFGQKIDARLFGLPRLGFFNLHPCKDDAWPSRYVGGNPFRLLLEDGSEYCVIAMHQVDEGFDTGPLRAFSARIPIPAGADVVALHKLTSPAAAELMVSEVVKMLRLPA